MANMTFTDSLEMNLALIEEIIRALPADEQNKARRACSAFEQLFDSLRKDYPNSPGVAMGAAYAVYQLGKRMVADGAERDGGGLIQLL